MKAPLILALILSVVASVANAACVSTQPYILHPTGCPDGLQVMATPAPTNAATPKAGKLPAPIGARHISGMPLGSVEEISYETKFASISPAAQAELERLGFVAVKKDHLQRLLTTVDEHIDLMRR